MLVFVLFALVAWAAAGPATENYKDQFCTDPRTMQKHQAYTEWADAYSCTRHRCQPGGRNLAIYTVGCKRVEAPESAIECEEVVEDTNMQFPYCCTRLRCLVVVRGEVWTRVLGQPWETLPAAPWSHMYKMKKPPPGDTTFLPKTPNEGPVYELASDVEGEKVLRSTKKGTTESPDCNEVAPRAVPTPDIVIALSTGADPKEHIVKSEPSPERERPHHKKMRKAPPASAFFEEENLDHHNEVENEEPLATEKPEKVDVTSEEKVYMNAYGVTQKPFKSNQHHQVAWTEIPPGQWSDHETEREHHQEPENFLSRDGNHAPEFPPIEEKSPMFKEEKPANLQALVDAIGTRMRDIENVVQRMSEKVHQVKPAPAANADGFASAEKRSVSDTETAPQQQPVTPPHKHHKEKEHAKDRPKRPNPDDHYKRFSVRNRGSKYLHTTDSTTEPPLFVEDNNMNGYFSDASNTVLRRLNPPKLKRPGLNSLNASRERSVEVLEEHQTRAPHAPHAGHTGHACNHTRVHSTHVTHEEHALEPAATYMAPVENRRKSTQILTSEGSEELEKKRKKHSHKKKKGKGKSRRKHHRNAEEKKKHVNKAEARPNSVEIDRNVVSLEDSSAVAMQ